MSKRSRRRGRQYRYNRSRKANCRKKAAAEGWAVARYIIWSLAGIALAALAAKLGVTVDLKPRQ